MQAFAIFLNPGSSLACSQVSVGGVTLVVAMAMKVLQPMPIHLPHQVAGQFASAPFGQPGGKYHCGYNRSISNGSYSADYDDDDDDVSTHQKELSAQMIHRYTRLLHPEMACLVNVDRCICI